METCPFCTAKMIRTSPLVINPVTLESEKQVVCDACGFKGTIFPERLQDIKALGGVLTPTGSVISLR